MEPCVPGGRTPWEGGRGGEVGLMNGKGFM